MAFQVEISIFPSGPFETNAYIVACSETREAAIIDPAPDSKELIVKAIADKQLKPTKIILTHSHWDHIADVVPLSELFGLPVLIHSEDAPNLMHPGQDQLPCWITIQGKQPDQLLKDGDTISIGKSEWRVIHTPGHSPGSICLFCEKEKILLSGDTLFKKSIGNLSFPTSEPERMWPSLTKLSLLPAETQVYPGHGESTTIGAEKWLARAKQIFG